MFGKHFKCYNSLQKDKKTIIKMNLAEKIDNKQL